MVRIVAVRSQRPVAARAYPRTIPDRLGAPSISRRAKQNAKLFAPSAGARVAAPPLLRWRKPANARFFNVQVYRQGHKVLSVWPTRARFRLHRSWTFAGRKYRLKAGAYTWLVWPAFGSQANPRYGKLLGQSTFVFGP